VQLLLSGVFDRYPKFKIYWAETQVGWLPYYYEQLDDVYKRSRHWVERYFGLKPLKREPSDYFREHFYWGNDFPHSAGDWPNSRRVIDDTCSGVRDDEKREENSICEWSPSFFTYTDPHGLWLEDARAAARRVGKMGTPVNALRETLISTLQKLLSNSSCFSESILNIFLSRVIAALNVSLESCSPLVMPRNRNEPRSRRPCRTVRK
jgi:hypothetical protein